MPVTCTRMRTHLWSANGCIETRKASDWLDVEVVCWRHVSSIDYVSTVQERLLEFMPGPHSPADDGKGTQI